MRILSTGDWHFNAGYDGDVLASVNQIIERIKHDDLDLVVITGDVYERSSDPTSRNMACDCIRVMASRTQVLVVRGNHDAIGDLQIYNKLDTSFPVSVHETPTLIKCRDSVMLHVMPWLTKARWQSIHTGASKEEGDQTVSQMVLDYLRNNVALNPEYKHVLIGHMTIAGAKAQNHQQLGADGVTLGVYDIKDAGFVAAMLGHIHLRQEIGGSSYFYNGSVAALNYGETPDKFYSIYDTDTDEVEWIELKTTHRQDVSACWGPLGIEMESVSPELLKGARIRANLRIVGGDNVSAAKEQLAKILTEAEVLEFQINPQVIPESKVRAVEIASAIKMGEKLKEYWKATGEPDMVVQLDMLDKLSELEDECSL